MSKIPNRNMKFKLNIVILGVLAFCFLILIFRIVYVACFAKIDGIKYGVKARNRQMSSNTIRAGRGTIYDKNMVPLAQSATVWIVSISPTQFKTDDQRKKVYDDLCNMLEIEKSDSLFQKFLAKRKYEIIKKNVEKPKRDELLAYIKKNKLSSIINIEEDTKRYYPLGHLASHTIGFVGADNQGLLGLELYYNKTLSGQNGKIYRIQDAKGGPMPYEFENLYPAKNGNSIVTSIDSVLQRICSEALSELHKWHEPANRCLAIIEDINTGEIVACCVHPEFDLNDPFEPPDEKMFAKSAELPTKEARALNWKNKCVSETYEPGSVFKVVTGSAALEEKTMSLNSSFNCSGAVVIQGERMKCWKRGGHGAQNFTQAFVNSCNPAFVAIGASLGPKTFSKYLDLFGITKKTKIDLPGEIEPIYHKEKNLSQVSLASESFGQSLSINPLQMINAFSAVVNGGFLYRPHILKQILDENGNIIKTNNKKIIHQVLSKETSSIMRNILTEVVKGPEGKGTNSSVSGYKVAGKTGTAQKLSEAKKTGKDTYVGSFVGLLTADNPLYAVMVLVDTPTGPKYYGSEVASPTFARIAYKLASYCGLAAAYTEEQYKQFFNNVPACEGLSYKEAKKVLDKSEFKNVILYGDASDTIIAQLPQTGVNVNKDTTIYLYTSEESLKNNITTIPKIVGMSYSRAKETLKSAGLNMVCENVLLKQSESATAMSQFPEEGTNVAKGTVVEVNFQMYDGTG